MLGEIAMNGFDENAEMPFDKREYEKMKITDIKFRKFFDEGNLKAIVSVTFDDCLVVHDIKVVQGSARRFVAMPSRKDETGIFRDIVHPINSAVRDEIEGAILDAYERYIAANENA